MSWKTIRTLGTALALFIGMAIAPGSSLFAQTSEEGAALSNGTQHRATVDPNGRF